MKSILALKAGERIQAKVTPTFEIFYNEGFGIYQAELENDETTVIKGNFPLPLNLKQVYRIDGEIVLRGFDKQVQVHQFKTEKPKGESDVIAYLQQLNGLKKRAETIYDIFKDKSIDMLKKHPEKVADQIKGVSYKKALEWQETLIEKEAEEEDMLYLLKLGLKSRQANLLIEHYGRNIRKQIKRNPYILLDVRSTSGFGFLKCDEIARKVGFDFGHPERIQHGILHVLKEASSLGHTYLPKEELIESLNDAIGVRLTFTQMAKIVREKANEIDIHSRTFKVDLDDVTQRHKKIQSLKRASAKEKYRYPLFEAETRQVEDALEALMDMGAIDNYRDRISLIRIKEKEESLAHGIYRVSQKKDWKESVGVETVLNDYLNAHGISLEEKQREAVMRFSEKEGGVYVLNGSAGSGKTFTLKIILEILKGVYRENKKPIKVKVLAPTGKASKVASKATGLEASTIHRGLEYMEGKGFQRNKENTLEENILVVDETSMMDVFLADSLFEAIATGTKVILLGDTKQLPSVGAGNVLHDIINSGVVEVVTLNVVKRQGVDSGLNENATKIIDGKMIETNEDTKDSFVLHEEEDSAIQKKTLQSINRLLQYPNYTFEDIQVLVPQKRGSIGVYEMNRLIQQTFNKENNPLEIRNILSPNVKLYFKKGDKVIHIRNNYDKVWYDLENGTYKKQQTSGITNGETGVIVDIIQRPPALGEKKSKKEIIVKYESGYMFYEEGEEIKDLDHAYCLSIHKSQGSQWKAVIMPISKQHAFFLDRNLVYTAWTRSQEFGAVIGPKKTLAMSIKKLNSIKRYTELQRYLVDLFQ